MRGRHRDFNVISICMAGILAVMVLLASPSQALLFDDDLPRETKLRNLNILSAGAVLAWGVANWDYFQESPQANSEAWFSHGTDEGGADKVGHLYTTYALSHLYASIYERWGYPQDQAIKLGTFSSLGVMTIMEAGDAFSDYGFSYEDAIMNCLGAVTGYWFGTHPEWQKRATLRLEYAPSLSDFETDVITDYEHHKYLLAIKGDGFDALHDTPLSYFELHVGYYTRGYDDYHPNRGDDDRERTAYIGAGLNVGKLIENIWDTRLFDYLQVPYTYVPLEHDLD